MNSTRHTAALLLAAAVIVLGDYRLSAQTPTPSYSPSSATQPTQGVASRLQIPASSNTYFDPEQVVNSAPDANRNFDDGSSETANGVGSEIDPWGGASALNPSADPTTRFTVNTDDVAADMAAPQVTAPADLSLEGEQSGYWRNQQVQEDAMRHFDNHLLDQTDVRNADTGETYTVQAGSSSYWTDPNVSAAAGTDTVIGSSDSTAPTPTATPLEEY